MKKKLMLRLITLSSIFLALACNRQTQRDEFTRYFEDGRAKPTVAIMPVIDSTTYDVSWSLSEELTQIIRNQIAQQNSLYVFPENTYTNSLSYNTNPYNNDLSWTNAFDPAEFVVVLELIQHEDAPNYKTKKNVSIIQRKHETSSNLNMALRIRIIDIRHNQPHIVLQELIKDSYFVSKILLNTNYNKITWGTDGYLMTPMGIAHKQLAKQITDRINDYVMLSKSR